ncbi:hypothetical protein BB561_001344 [Smittium simulii]|uniref:Paired domain-containing protein n=1 Tax=Smittium simulii TaxID=133385 RepID=A0A2T9YV04_9FUNG|nr:hypothetical protein BB561_001344 [Smittium simulii]
MALRVRYKKISNETRLEIINNYLSGKQMKKISMEFDISLSTISSILKVYGKEFRIEKKQRGGTKNRKILPEHEFFIINALNKNGTLSLNMLKKMTNEKFNIDLSTSTIKRCCDSNSYKLNRVSGVLIRTKV